MWATAPTRQAPRKRKHQKNQRGERLAVIRALTGARLYRDGKADTLAEAAEKVGSCVAYVRAAITLYEADDINLLIAVRLGCVSLLVAAAKARRRIKLIDAYEQASPDDRKALGEMVGVGVIWDETIAPTL
jgi:hypothetical protein